MVKPKSLGHVVLRVRELARAESFYTKILSLDVQAKIDDKMVFLTSNTESSHELALQEIGRDAPGPNPDGVGLYHTAWRYSSLEELRKLHKTLIENSIESGIGNHGISIGIYFLIPMGMKSRPITNYQKLIGQKKIYFLVTIFQMVQILS